MEHNHLDPDERSDACPACAQLDRLDDDYRIVVEPAVEPAAEPETGRSPTAGRPAAGEETPTDPLGATEPPADASAGPSETEERPLGPAVAPGQTSAIPIDEILDDAADNVARGCAPVADSKRLRQLAESMKNGQQQPIKVRPMPPQGRRRYRVVFGFRRLAAARKLGWETIEASVVKASDAQATAMNWMEGCRAEATPYQISAGLSACKQAGLDVATISAMAGILQEDAEILIKIMERCSPRLLAIFQADPSPRVMRVLRDLSEIEAAPEDLHWVQEQGWIDFRTAEQAALEKQIADRDQKKKQRKAKGRPAMSAAAVAALIERVRHATEWHDGERYQPMTEDTRALAVNLLFAIRGSRKMLLR